MPEPTNSPEIHSAQATPSRFRGRNLRAKLKRLVQADFWRTAWQLKKLRNRYEGQRCFVLGNGPSLKKTDLSLLKNEITFGSNRIYMAFPEMGFQTTFLGCIDLLVVESNVEELQSLNMPFFTNWRARKFFLDTPKKNILYMYDPWDGRLGFSTTPAWRVFEGATVTNIHLQMAFHMGFTQVILIGIDHSWNIPIIKQPTQLVSTGHDTDHFIANYYKPGQKFDPPAIETIETSYALARDYFAAHNREIIDATVGGKLQVFRKVDYLSLFAASSGSLYK